MTRRKKKSDRRFDVLAAIRANPRASLRELAEATGMKSISNVHYHLKSLEDEGYIQRKDWQARSITLRGQQPVIRSTRRNDRPATRAKKSAGGQKARILQTAGKGPAGIDRETWERMEAIGKREDERKAKLHSTDVVFDYHHGAVTLKCQKLG